MSYRGFISIFVMFNIQDGPGHGERGERYGFIRDVHLVQTQ